MRKYPLIQRKVIAQITLITLIFSANQTNPNRQNFCIKLKKLALRTPHKKSEAPIRLRSFQLFNPSLLQSFTCPATAHSGTRFAECSCRRGG